jgi:hypothetical protein
MMTFNQLKRRILVYGGLFGGAGILLGGMIGVSMNGEGSDGSANHDAGDPSTNKKSLGIALAQEMDARFANPEDALDTKLFATTEVFGKIWVERSDSRWNEAASRVNLALNDSFEAVGATSEDGNGPTEIAHLRAAAACAAWLLNGEEGNAPTALQEPTRAAYAAGNFAVAEDRCRGALVRRVAEGELDYIVVVTDLED